MLHDDGAPLNLQRSHTLLPPPLTPGQVALSPQRPRTIISFENRCWSSDGRGACPALTMFPHTEGAKVGMSARTALPRWPCSIPRHQPCTAVNTDAPSFCAACCIIVTAGQVSEGLFNSYSLPNGRTAYLYCNAGSAMDEAEVGPVLPPARPTTVPLALQQSMPLAQVCRVQPAGQASPLTSPASPELVRTAYLTAPLLLHPHHRQVMDMIAKPPGSAPPFRPYKPVPRLVPLPGSHTLTVARPELRTAESYGVLRADNLQLVLKAEVCCVCVWGGGHGVCQCCLCMCISMSRLPCTQNRPSCAARPQQQRRTSTCPWPRRASPGCCPAASSSRVSRSLMRGRSTMEQR
jgi:hypothetical protein